MERHDDGEDHAAALIKIVERALRAHYQARRWILSYSGGIDSSCLLNLLCELRLKDSSLPPLSALHINHHIHPEANIWSAWVKSRCQELGIPMQSVNVYPSQTRRRGLEDAARKARYQAFAEHIGAGDCLLLAHHLDDQVETLFLRLLRGAGIEGLASMATERELGAGQLLRPLLTVSREQLRDYAQARELKWIEDQSNFDLERRRNYLRHLILPALEKQWPGYRHNVTRTIQIARDNAELLCAQGEYDCTSCLGVHRGLSVQALLKLSNVRRDNALRYWLRQLSITAPPRKIIKLLHTEVLLAKPDARPCLRWGNSQVCRYQGELHAMRQSEQPPKNLHVDWNLKRAIKLPGCGLLRAHKQSGRLRLAADKHVTIRLPNGGERCQMRGEYRKRKIADVLRAKQVPYWLRERVPLIFSEDGNLLAIADLLICEQSAQTETAETSYRLAWEPPLPFPARGAQPEQTRSN